jgi:hypothetical protein
MFGAGYADRLVLDPGASLVGKVDGGNTLGSAVASTLELATGASTGTISGLGSQFVNFATVEVDSGAFWAAAGTDTVAAHESLLDYGTLDFLGGLSNTGLIDAAGGTLSLAQGISGSGSVEVESSGVVSIGGAAYGSLIFNDATGTLDLAAPSSFHSLISGFVTGDVIDLVSTAVTTISYSGGDLSVKDGTTTIATLRFSGSFSQSDFTYTADGNQGTFIEHT